MKPICQSHLAVYIPSDRSKDLIVRHVADTLVWDHSADKELFRDIHEAALVLPEGAEYLSAEVVIAKNADGYAATMAKVNVGTPGRPA